MITMNKYARSVIKLIFMRGASTRSEIMRTLKMRLNAIVEVCNELEEQHLIIREESGRKRNSKLSLNPQCFVFIGIEHHLSGVDMVAVDADGHKLGVSKVELPAQERLRHLLASAKAFCSKFETERIRAIGLSDIGLVDPARKIGVYSAHLSGWKDIPLGETFQAEFPCEFYLIDRVDADCFSAHSADESHPHVYVNVIPDGIGMSLRDPSNFWQTHMPMSGQIGHLVVAPNGELCHCGNRGCLETVSGVRSILERLFTLTGRRFTEGEALKSAAAGDRLCETVLREAGEYMGETLAKVVTILGVGAITMRGALCDRNGAFFSGVRQALFKNVIYPLNKTLLLDSETRQEGNTALGTALFARCEYVKSL